MILQKRNTSSIKLKTLLVTFLFIPFLISAQIKAPVKWASHIEKANGNNYNLVFEATIENSWHMYALNIPEGGPIPTSFHINETPDFKLINGVIEKTAPEISDDPFFNMKIGLHSNKAIFTQEISPLTKEEFIIKGYVEFMSCDDHSCLPPSEDEFSLKIPKNESLASQVNTKDTVAVDIIPENIISENDSIIRVANIITLAENDKTETSNSLILFFLIAFIAGLGGVLTPCVFPMIPMTVTFFMRGSENRANSIIKGLVFGFSIVAIYTLIGVIVSITSMGADFAYQLSTHWLPNTIFFLLFLVFAASFLGLFELVLPSRLVNKADQQADKGGIAGAFFMAFTLVLVSFSCTGPIVGALLVEAAGGLAWKPILGMFGFSLAFALPFTLFAVFPSWLKSLPKSGGWLNSVKVVMGFLVLAFGFKFLGNINQTYHLELLNRDVFLSFWIVIFTFLGLYLIGKIKFAHDSDLPFISVPRLFLAILTFTFVMYLITGILGAPLNTISGLIPPKNTASLDLSNSNVEIVSPIEFEKYPGICKTPSYNEIFQLPLGLQGYFDFEEALACAKEQNKPLFLDFKGHSCSNCKEVEAKVWSDHRVQKILKENYIIVALYVDDRTELPAEKWITSSFDGKVKKTIGKKWADFQITRFKTNTQPYYIILNPEEKIIAGPVGFETNVEKYLEFLKEGISK